ncbi:MAG: S8/S53 family peptidase [Planctomycetes bacterium]|nr:S8/S53 family peptidase [Planctomycetota bacterium]
MRIRHLLSLSSLVLVASVATAQQPAQAGTEAPVTQPATGNELLPGKTPGTYRYNVTFRTRSFDLSEFRDAIHTGRTADDVQRIVAGLEAKARKDQAGFTRWVEDRGGKVNIHFWLINAASIEIAPEHVVALRALDNVFGAEADRATEPLAPIITATNASNHNADAVQGRGVKGTGFSLAIIDTGQDSNMNNTGRPHRTYYRNGDPTDLTGGGMGGSLLYANKAIGGQPADDTHGHGTGVLGIAGGARWLAANADNGHAFDAGKVGYSICVTAGSCGSSLAIEAAGWQAAAADRALYNIVAGNMSYSSTSNPLDVSQQAIDACALNADLLPVVAAGNSSSSTTGSSAIPNGLAVAAITPTTKTVATFSSRGPLAGDTARFYPDIAACGVNTVMPLRNNESGNYTASGTSMASPQVCGAATLVKSAAPGRNAMEIKAILLCNLEDISAQNPVAPYNSRNAYGMGFLRDDLAIDNSGPGKALSSTIASTTAPNVHFITVVPGRKHSVSLVFYRHTLTSSAWSNLDLRVYDGATLVGSSTTTRNLYEVVRFTAPAAVNTLRVEVSAVSLEIASVPYALATDGEFPGAAAFYKLYGNACAGSSGTPALTVAGHPVTGTSMTIRLHFAKPGTPGFLMFGASKTNWGTLALPFSLGALAPNCSILASGDLLSAFVTTATGQNSTTLAIPNSPALLGNPFFNQYVIQDAVNPLGVVLSNAGEGKVGDF